MAPEEIDPSDQTKVRKVLSTKIRNYFLIFVGVVILIIGYLLISGGSGSLFKGFIGEEPPAIPGAEFPPTIVSTTPVNNATDMPRLSAMRRRCKYLKVFDIFVLKQGLPVQSLVYGLSGFFTKYQTRDLPQDHQLVN